MRIIYWLMIRDGDGKIVDIQEAEWTFFYNRNGDFRVPIKKLLQKGVRNGESFEFGRKSHFENRGIINTYEEGKGT